VLYLRQNDSGKKGMLYSGNMGYMWQPYDFISDSARIQHFNINKKIEICPECLNKYGTSTQEKMDRLWDKTIAKLISKNDKKRKKYAEARRQNRINEIEKQIKQLKTKIEKEKQR